VANATCQFLLSWLDHRDLERGALLTDPYVQVVGALEEEEEEEQLLKNLSVRKNIN
jgi:hypothetical protein